MIEKKRGYYFGEYEIVSERYLGKDFSRRCFIFPGQGVANPGMMKEVYLQTKIIQDKFLEADYLAKKFGLPKISAYILNPEILDEEMMHIVANLALFTLECALFDVLIFEKIIPQMLTGHSFGEYAAIVSSGMVSFADMFNIVYQREKLCPMPNVAGHMIAIRAAANEVKDILGKNEYSISNLNSPNQTVISVSPKNMERIKNILKDKKTKHIVLVKVSQPYHSPYLNMARDDIVKYIENNKLIIKKPKIPLYSSVLKKMIDKDNFEEKEIEDILKNQITEPVNFIKQIRFSYTEGCANFLEVGPKKIFSGFVEEILDNEKIKTDFVANLSIFKKEKAQNNNQESKVKLFSMASKIIGKITGYEIERISFEDRFQEDLGIDSIKKADILLTILDESGIEPGEDFNTSQFKSVEDAVRYIETAQKRGELLTKKQTKREADFRRWIFSWKKQSLNYFGKRVIRKYGNLSFDLSEIFNNQKEILKKISAYLKSAPANERCLIMHSNFLEFDYDDSLTFFKFFQTFFTENEVGKFDLLLVSYGKESACLDGYASFFKSVKKEFPGMFFKYIRFADEINKKEVVEIASQESAEPIGVDVLYQNGKRFVSEISADESADGGEEWLNNGCVIVAIGGAKGITFSLMKRIARKYKPKLYLLGRSPKDNEAVQHNLTEFRKAKIDAAYISVDASDKDSLDGVFARIRKECGKIDLVVNGAGVVAVNFLVKKSDEEIAYEFRNKVLPAWNVLELADKYAVAKTINFSSIISKYGSAGQSIYTAANAMVNGFSREKASVIHWPAWDGVGMTADRVTLQKFKEFGIALLSPERADALFFADLSSRALTQVYYIDRADDASYSFPLADLQTHKSLLGDLDGNFILGNQNIIFRKNFDLAVDTYLNDHQVGTHVYVPAATGLAMFFCLANIYFKKNPVLKDMVMTNPIVVRKNSSINCNLEAEEKKEKKLSLFLKSSIVHFSGLAQVDESNGSSMVKLALSKGMKEIGKEQRDR